MKSKKLFLVLGGLVALLVLWLVFRKKKVQASVATPVGGLSSDLFAENYNRRTGGKINTSVLAYRANNPGCLRWFGSVWQGLDTAKTKMNEFCYFLTLDYGVRAQCKLLLNYLKDGVNTPTKIINKWAPAADGNVPAKYVDFVTAAAGLNPNEVLSKANISKLAKFAYYQHIMEAGFAFVDASVYETGFNTLINEGS